MVKNSICRSGRDATSGDLVIKAINISMDPVKAAVNVSGVANFSQPGQQIVLTSVRLADNNSLENPTNVVPETSGLAAQRAGFAHEFPPNSLTVLRLKTE